MNPVQQATASTAAALVSFGSKLWIACGLVFLFGLVGLAMTSFLPRDFRERFRNRGFWKVFDQDWVFLSIAVLAILVLRIPSLTFLELNPDESGLILGARTLVDDPRFWVSFENTTLGPLSTFSVAAPGLFGFSIDYTSTRILAILTWCLVIVFTFMGLRAGYGPPLARLLILPLGMSAATFTFWDYLAFNGEHMAVLLLAIAFWMQASLVKDPDGAGLRCAFLLGVALALVPFAKIQPGPLAVGWGFVACVVCFRLGRRYLGWLVAGALVPLVILIVYLTVVGAWYDFLQSYILNNMLYASDGWNASKREVSFFANALQAPGFFLGPRDTRGFFVFVFLVGAVGVAWGLASRDFRRKLWRSDVVLSVITVAAAAVCVILPKNNWTHYLFLLFIPMSMLVAAVLSVVFELAGQRRAELTLTLSGPERTWTVSAPVVLALVVAVLGAVFPVVYGMMAGNPAFHAARANLEQGAKPGRVAGEIRSHVGTGNPVAHWGVRLSEVCEAGVSLGTRDAHNERALYPSVQQDYYLARWIADLKVRQPEYVVDSCTGERFDHLKLERFPREWAEVSARYALVEDVEGFRIFRRRSVPDIAASE